VVGCSDWKNELNCRIEKLQDAQCEEKLREKEQKLNRKEKVEREECAHIKKDEKDRERIDRQRQQVKPNMNREEE
jgi:hypothetical protein